MGQNGFDPVGEARIEAFGRRALSAAHFQGGQGGESIRSAGRIAKVPACTEQFVAPGQYIGCGSQLIGGKSGGEKGGGLLSEEFGE
jgi:hypothetical protein